jgi:hypothetical protein
MALPRRTRILWPSQYAALIGAALLAACATFNRDWGPAPDGASVTLRANGQADILRVTDTVVDGPSSGVMRSRGTMRGRIRGIPVELVSDGATRIRGSFDARPVQLHVAPATDPLSPGEPTLSIRGLWGGALTNFRVSTHRIRGIVGRSVWDFRREPNGRWFEAVQPTQVRLALPDDFDALEPLERVMLLSLALGS